MAQPRLPLLANTARRILTVDVQTLFFIGMDRDLPDLLTPPEGLSIGLGESGTKAVGTDANLGLPDWHWPHDPIPVPDGSVAIFHAYHFLEHLTGEEAIKLLKEVERKLVLGGILQFCIPYYSSNMAAQDLTHKSMWTEDTFKTLFRNNYYDPTAGGVVGWKLQVHFQAIMGVAERNMALVGQLVKVA